MISETHKIIKEYTSNIAFQVGIPLSKIVLVEGEKVGCLDIHLMNLTAYDNIISVLIYQSDIDNLQEGKNCDRLEMKIQTALSRLNSLRFVTPPTPQ
jgi:hypothetical protein